MFCPGCGLKEDRPVQFCRACGADLRAVRETLERPEAAEPSVVAAREEVTRALAARIKEGEWWHVGALVPEVEKLFESPRANGSAGRTRSSASAACAAAPSPRRWGSGWWCSFSS